jgi:glutathione peroxidase
MSIYSIQAKDIQGKETSLQDYKGKVLLIVNVASRCGFTPQYSGLEKLYQKWKSKGLVILGFPCNQFGKQEPGTESEIKEFCDSQYQVSFPLFAKVEVNGPHSHPLYQFLKAQAKGILGSESIKWNFTKFLVDQNGQVIKRFAPVEKPESIEKSIRDLLKE